MNTNGDFDVKLNLKNTGSADATVDKVFLNGKPPDATEYTGTITGLATIVDQPLKVGDTLSNTLTLKKGGIWKSGMSVELTVQTVNGTKYTKVIILS